MVVPDRDSSAPFVWTASRRTLFGWSEWDNVTGPTKKYDVSISEESSQEKFKLQPDDVAGLDGLAKAAIARAALGEGSAVADMVLTEAPQFIRPEEPRWTVRIAGRYQTAQVFADRHGALFPAPSPRVGEPRILVYALSDTWIRVRDSNQTVLFDDVLKAGSSYPVPNAPGLTSRTGKAEGLGSPSTARPPRRSAAPGPAATSRSTRRSCWPGRQF